MDTIRQKILALHAQIQIVRLVTPPGIVSHAMTKMHPLLNVIVQADTIWQIVYALYVQIRSVMYVTTQDYVLHANLILELLQTAPA